MSDRAAFEAFDLGVLDDAALRLSQQGAVEMGNAVISAAVLIAELRDIAVAAQAALAASEASRLSVEGERDDTLGLLAMMRNQLTMAQGERAALERAREIIAEIDEYQKRPERGDPDHECACCMGELLDDHRAVIAQIDEALSLLVGAGEQDSTCSQDPGPHPCGSQLEPASMQGAPLTGGGDQ